MLRFAFLLLSGNAATSILTLGRNLLIARLISIEDYGIAATFAIAMAVVEMISAIGMEQQIVQSKRGDDPKFQAALQGFTVLRGLISFVVLFATAGLMADFLNVPNLAWAYQVMALVPLIRGFGHFDNNRFKRSMRFGPMLWAQGGSALLAVAVVWPAYLIWGDYRVMLASLLVQAITSTIITHMLAEWPYRLSIATTIWRDSMGFGWPLMINGILLFAVMHGEKLIAGRILGLEELGVLALGLTLTMTPTLILARSMQTLFLSRLSAAQDDDVAFQSLAEMAIQSVLVMTLLYLLGVFLLGGPLVMLLMGAKYAALPPLMTWLAIQQSLRVFKAGGSTVALARGQTANAMIANSVRVISLPVAAWVATAGGGLMGMIYVAAAGEALGLVISLALVAFRSRVSMRRLALPLTAGTVAIGVIGAVSWWIPPTETAGIPGGLASTIAVITVLIALGTMGQVIGQVLRSKGIRS